MSIGNGLFSTASGRNCSNRFVEGGTAETWGAEPASPGLPDTGHDDGQDYAETEQL